MDRKEAINQCKRSGLAGIELIEYAQRLVGSNMKYSYTNSFDLPGKAFQKGQGYCWHQASVLNYILKWNRFVCFFSYWGSAAVNHKRIKEIKKSGQIAK